LKTLKNIDSLKQTLIDIRKNNQSIGFVPTMGALHQGHLSLINKSKKENDITICSIYVNPTQFNNKQDLIKYPRNIENDIAMLHEIHCDILFVPSNEEMYARNEQLGDYNISEVMNLLEGEKRPGHFTGVITIVHKLFHLIKPHRSYFGEKDYQQIWLIKLFVKKIKSSTKIITCPTIRDDDGLALSSRNARLNLTQRKAATILFQTIDSFKDQILKIKKRHHNNRIDISILKYEQIKMIHQYSFIKLDYFEVIDVENFSFATEIVFNKNYRILIAAFIGEIRLIDNILID
tara:strand:- start:10331 stop:11203 length:873 start_codon:yes stop_codon:yes gene_type:complete